jgi:hypothetical protein
MRCNGGQQLTLDAQPGTNPGWAAGTVTSLTGFRSVTLRSGGAGDPAVHSFMGVGATSGTELTFACPDGMVVVGLSGGARTRFWPRSHIVNLQILCGKRE